MICGHYPFDMNSVDDPMKIPKKIREEKLYFPDYVKDHNLMDFISQLLNKNQPEQRLCSTVIKDRHPKTKLKF